MKTPASPATSPLRLALLPALAAIAMLGVSACDAEEKTTTESSDTASATSTESPEGAAKPKAAGKPVAVSGAEFDAQVLKSDQLVLVDFWAEWCGPCKAIAPTIDQIAADFDGRVLVAKADVDDPGIAKIAEGYGISTIPNLKIFKDGEIVGEFRGLPSKADIAKLLEKHL